MLLHERGTQLDQVRRGIFEHAEDGFAVGDVEGDDLGFAVAGAFEAFGGGVELILPGVGG